MKGEKILKKNMKEKFKKIIKNKKEIPYHSDRIWENVVEQEETLVLAEFVNHILLIKSNKVIGRKNLQFLEELESEISQRDGHLSRPERSCQHLQY